MTSGRILLKLLTATLFAVSGVSSVTVRAADGPTEKMFVGKVSRENGKPLKGAWVSILQRTGGSLFIPTATYERLGTAQTRSDGTFSVRAAKWNDSAKHEFVIPGTTRQRIKIKGQLIEPGRIVKREIESGTSINFIVPNDFVPQLKDPRRGLLDDALPTTRSN